MSKAKVATLWLDGCSGCHMSLLDMDERLLALSDQIDLVYSPLVDAKAFPEGVDITLVEGAVSTSDDLEKIRHVRARTRLLVSLGDCAVMGNVPAMRNTHGAASVLRRVFPADDAATQPPTHDVPELLAVVRPVHAVVPVDVYLPGCPPGAQVITFVLTELLAGRMPDLHGMTRFGG